MNSGRAKVMVDSSGGKMIVNSGKWPCCQSHSEFQLFGELPVPPLATGVLETLNICSFLYHSGILSTIIIIIP